MNKYIVSKKHKTTNYIGASVVTASVLLSSPVILNADSTSSKPTVLPIKVVETKEKEQNYTNSYKVDKSSSSKITQDLLDTPQTISVVTEKVLKEQQATTLQEALRDLRYNFKPWRKW